jgi:hypothetical protein
MMMHDATGMSLSQERLKDILQAVEMLKAIEIEFKTKKFMINQIIILMNRTQEIKSQFCFKGLCKMFIRRS